MCVSQTCNLSNWIIDCDSTVPSAFMSLTRPDEKRLRFSSIVHSTHTDESSESRIINTLFQCDVCLLCSVTDDLFPFNLKLPGAVVTCHSFTFTIHPVYTWCLLAFCCLYFTTIGTKARYCQRL